jgi:molybdopterin synthase catalytic subunit
LNGLQEFFEKADQIVDNFKDNDPFYDKEKILSKE